MQHFNAVADDVLMRGKQIPRQGFPVRKQPQRQVRVVGQIEIQAVMQLLGTAGVRGDQQDQAGGFPGQCGKGNGQRAVVQPAPVAIVVATGGEQGVVGKQNQNRGPRCRRRF